MHVLVVKRVARFHALAELAECRHPHPRSPIEIFIDRIVGKHLSRYQSVHHAVHCAGMPSLRIRWFMCNVNYACKLFLGPFCLSAIPHRRCWWMRPAQLHTHKGTIIMRLLVVCRWVCVCVCVWTEHRRFSPTPLYFPFICDDEKRFICTPGLRPLPLQFKHFYLVPKLLCTSSQRDARGLRSAHHVNANGEHEIQTPCAKCVIIIITIIISSPLLKCEFSTNIRTLRIVNASTDGASASGNCERDTLARGISTNLAIPGNGILKCVFFLSFDGCECYLATETEKLLKFITITSSSHSAMARIRHVCIEQLYRERDLQNEMKARSSRTRSVPQWPFFGCNHRLEYHTRKNNNKIILIPTPSL